MDNDRLGPDEFADRMHGQIQDYLEEHILMFG